MLEELESEEPPPSSANKFRYTIQYIVLPELVFLLNMFSHSYPYFTYLSRGGIENAV